MIVLNIAIWSTAERRLPPSRPGKCSVGPLPRIRLLPSRPCLVVFDCPSRCAVKIEVLCSITSLRRAQGLHDRCACVQFWFVDLLLVWSYIATVFCFCFFLYYLSLLLFLLFVAILPAVAVAAAIVRLLLPCWLALLLLCFSPSRSPPPLPPLPCCCCTVGFWFIAYVDLYNFDFLAHARGVREKQELDKTRHNNKRPRNSDLQNESSNEGDL